jgi:hypothetical protein
MSGIILDPPTLSYVGAVDVATASGSTLYNILFDASLVTLGSVLMFEYKLQPQNVLNPDENVFLGFINTEDSNFQAGIANQWQICVPAQNEIYNPSTPLTIQVRVYIGLYSNNSIVVTPWSDPLDVHNPPAQPAFFQYDGNDLVFYDIGANGALDDLYVCLAPNPTYDPAYPVNFIVAYYYTDNATGTTVWNLSSPVAGENRELGDDSLILVTVPDFGKVSSVAGKDVVYVAVYAVFDFEDASNNTFYSVSHMSDRATAQDSTYFAAPTLAPVDYKVYTTSTQDQIMTLSWLAPGDSIADIFVVDHYVLQVSVNGGVWNDISNNIINTTYDYDVSGYSCQTNGVPTNLNFRVYAINTTGGDSPNSNTESKNMFRYSGAPQNLIVSDVIVSEGAVEMTVSFDQPASLGCGDGYQYIVTIDGLEQTPISYVSGSITQTFTGLNIASQGTVSVYLKTVNTNPEDGTYMDGDVASTPYIAITLTLADPIQYEIYNPAPYSLPIMDLSWNNVVVLPWTLVNYEVEVSVNGGGFGPVLPATTTQNTFFYYDTIVNGNICDEELTFRITAHLSQTVGGVTTTYDIQSNTASKNVFEYSLAPASGNVNWAVRDPSENTMSVDITFTNPTSVGCGEPVNFVVNVYNAPSGGNIIYTLSPVQTYNPSASEYNINMDLILYASNGRVEVYLITTDTNGGSNNNGAIATYSFTTNEVPIYRNVVLSSSVLTFDIISATLLAPVAGLVFPSNGALSYINWLTNEASQSGITVSENIDPYGEHIYSVTILPSFTGGSFPLVFGIVSANSAGIGELSLPVVP